mgnify:CR=1 FL=1
MSLSILVILHELGHFIPAKLFGTRVEKFYLFFDVKYSLFKNYVHYIQSSKKGSLKTTLFIESLAQFAKGKSLADVFNLEDLNINEEEFLDLVEMVFILMINTYLKTENGINFPNDLNYLPFPIVILWKLT